MSIKQPEPLRFTGNVSQNWEVFKQRMGLFLEATNPKANAKQKGATLLHCIGEEELRVYNTFAWEAGQEKLDFDSICTKFAAHCQPIKNCVFQRHKFWTLTRGTGSVDQFLTEVRNMAEQCDFADAEKENLIRDKLVFSLPPSEVKQKLL